MLRIFGNTLEEGALKEITEKNTVSDSIGEINIANSERAERKPREKWGPKPLEHEQTPFLGAQTDDSYQHENT